MKKSLVATLTGALVVGATATTFAAANPFSDVPAGHWAYNSVTKLTQDGIIEGYGDGTFRGNRQITRYEMAQMVARALAKTPTTTISTANRAELDKLSAEFRDELDNLGVRIDELERNADKVKWAGKIEYTYGKLKNKTAHTESTGNGGVFRLEPVAEVNDHWTANARFDAGFDAKNDTTNEVKLKRWFAKGDYDKFSVTFGRFGYCPNEGNVAVDTVVSGAQMSFGSKWKFTATGGRVSGAGDGNEASYLMTGGMYNNVNYTDGAFKNDPMDLVGINVQYDQGETGLFGGGSWYYAKNSDFRNTFYSNDGTTDKANVWAANLGYRIAENLTVSGAGLTTVPVTTAQGSATYTVNNKPYTANSSTLEIAATVGSDSTLTNGSVIVSNSVTATGSDTVDSETVTVTLAEGASENGTVSVTVTVTNGAVTSITDLNENETVTFDDKTYVLIGNVIKVTDENGVDTLYNGQSATSNLISLGDSNFFYIPIVGDNLNLDSGTALLTTDTGVQVVYGTDTAYVGSHSINLTSDTSTGYTLTREGNAEISSALTITSTATSLTLKEEDFAAKVSMTTAGATATVNDLPYVADSTSTLTIDISDTGSEYVTTLYEGTVVLDSSTSVTTTYNNVVTAGDNALITATASAGVLQNISGLDTSETFVVGETVRFQGFWLRRGAVHYIHDTPRDLHHKITMLFRRFHDIIIVCWTNSVNQ